jgi:hypothetical protein
MLNRMPLSPIADQVNHFPSRPLATPTRVCSLSPSHIVLVCEFDEQTVKDWLNRKKSGNFFSVWGEGTGHFDRICPPSALNLPTLAAKQTRKPPLGSPISQEPASCRGPECHIHHWHWAASARCRLANAGNRHWPTRRCSQSPGPN